MPAEAFISYASKDKPAADAACAALEGAGVACWMAPRNIKPGMEYGAAIVDAIDACRVMVLIFSSAANELRQVHREVERAVNKGIPIVPMRIEPVVPKRSLEFFLGAIHWLDAFAPPLTGHLEQLVDTVQGYLGVEATHAPAPDDRPSQTSLAPPPQPPQPQPAPQPQRAPRARRSPANARGATLITLAAMLAVVVALLALYFGGAIPGSTTAAQRIGEVYRDRLANGQPCPMCPELIVVPAGKFEMGSAANEVGRTDSEGPLHEVTIAKPFAVGRYPVTHGEFAAYIKARVQDIGECTEPKGGTWRAPGTLQDDRHPVVCVSWKEAKEFVVWLSTITGKTYRLLTEAEREYVTRAGSTTPYWWGSSIAPFEANYQLEGQQQKGTVPVDSYRPNPWGLYNVHGNSFDWTEDCWNPSYQGAPSDGSAWLSGDCIKRVRRGGYASGPPNLARSAARSWTGVDGRYFEFGLRVASTLSP